MKPKLYERYGKRLLDLIGGLGGLAVLSPLFAIVAAATKFDSHGAVFFTQERVGRGGAHFQMVKFRTMLPLEDSVDADGQPLANYDRVTRVGRILRSTSLDEVPQLINVVKGEMSLVGPRPTLKYQVDRYTPEQKRRLLVRPGLTGLAQVSGRNHLTWDEKIAWDLKYVQNLSLTGDARIILRTIKTVFERDGVSFRRYDGISDHGSTGYQGHI